MRRPKSPDPARSGGFCSNKCKEMFLISLHSLKTEYRQKPDAKTQSKPVLGFSSASLQYKLGGGKGMLTVETSSGAPEIR